MDTYNNPTHVPVILIVDDNPQNLQILGKQLQEKNYEIEFAINGPAALEWIDIKQFDLILLDINMPEMSGFDVCKIIRSNQDMNNVPIIFLSAETERESILRGFELGAQDYITKPFDSRELIVRVKTHITLKETLEELLNLNRSLEEKVLERTNQLIEANDKLEAINNKLIDLDMAKTEFLHLISHEIRTPLNGILGPLELLKGSIDTSEISNLVGMLDTSVKRLECFSLDALLITRLKTKQAEIKKESISLSKLFSEVLNVRKEEIKSKGIKVKAEFDLKHDFILGETELVKKSIINILDNSIFYSPQKGSVAIRTYIADNFNVFELRDQGPGFAPETKDYLTELFTCTDNSRDTSKGIGLPIVKMIMKSHGGDIILDNHPKGGAVVKLLFLIVQ